jgi:hypothetical protein
MSRARRGLGPRRHLRASGGIVIEWLMAVGTAEAVLKKSEEAAGFNKLNSRGLCGALGDF